MTRIREAGESIHPDSIDNAVEQLGRIDARFQLSAKLGGEWCVRDRWLWYRDAASGGLRNSVGDRFSFDVVVAAPKNALWAFSNEWTNFCATKLSWADLCAGVPSILGRRARAAGARESPVPERGWAQGSSSFHAHQCGARPIPLSPHAMLFRRAKWRKHPWTNHRPSGRRSRCPSPMTREKACRELMRT